MKKLTAVEWLIEEISKYEVGVLLLKLHKEQIKQAKELEKEQIVDAFKKGQESILKLS